jgi:class 3 adenylate cyclase
MTQSGPLSNEDPQGTSAVAETRDLYVRLVLERHSCDVDLINIACSVAFHACFLVLDLWTGPPSMQLPLLYMHVSFLAAASLWLSYSFLRRRRPDFRAFGQILSVSVIVTYGYVNHRLTVDQDPLLLRFAVTELIAALFVMIANPARRLAVHLPTDLICILTVALATYRHPDGLAIALQISSMTLGALALRRFHWESVRRKALRDFERQSKLAPPHIVVKAVTTSQPVEQLFAPSSRLCCCISSDWRNYTAMAAQQTPERMAVILGQYYDASLAALRTVVPNEKYFCDWIADELFIVLFGDDPEEERQLVNQALLFACRLVLIKERFRLEVGIPAAIDVGVACGAAFTGIMGPQANRKATSIGDVPCRARRLQNGGKLLRDRVGDTDRVVFGHDALMRISSSHSVEEYELRPGESVRDLDDRALFYIEPLKVDVLTGLDGGLVTPRKSAS